MVSGERVEAEIGIQPMTYGSGFNRERFRRRRVLEDGRDVSDSGDEDDEEMVADEEKGMYTDGMDPELGPQRLSQAEAARQRLIAKATRAAGFPESPKSVVLSTDAQIFPSMKEADEAITRSRTVIASASPKNGVKAHPAALIASLHRP
jgi:hypothetical protein